MNFTLYDHNESALILHERFIRFENRIFDASCISTIRVKKNKILFNSFKQNTTLPTLSVSFNSENEAVNALDKCAELYRSNGKTFCSREDADVSEYYLPDAYGTNLIVTPEYLNYRNRIVSAVDVKTVTMKGRRVLINNFKGNVGFPTMCIHFQDKEAAFNAMNRIHGVLWDVYLRVVPHPKDEKPEPAPEESVLTKPVDPVFLNFVMGMTGFLFILNIIRVFTKISGPGDYDDEL